MSNTENTSSGIKSDEYLYISKMDRSTKLKYIEDIQTIIDKIKSEDTLEFEAYPLFCNLKNPSFEIEKKNSNKPNVPCLEDDIAKLSEMKNYKLIYKIRLDLIAEQVDSRKKRPSEIIDDRKEVLRSLNDCAYDYFISLINKHVIPRNTRIDRLNTLIQILFNKDEEKENDLANKFLRALKNELVEPPENEIKNIQAKFKYEEIQHAIYDKREGQDIKTARTTKHSLQTEPLESKKNIYESFYLKNPYEIFENINIVNLINYGPEELYKTIKEKVKVLEEQAKSRS